MFNRFYFQDEESKEQSESKQTDDLMVSSAGEESLPFGEKTMSQMPHRPLVQHPVLTARSALRLPVAQVGFNLIYSPEMLVTLDHLCLGSHPHDLSMFTCGKKPTPKSCDVLDIPMLLYMVLSQ